MLGPERPHPVLPAVLDRLGARGPLALISAGWRYDEDRDEPLRAAVGRTVHNLRLYHAFQDIERDAPELAAAHARKQAGLKAAKARYRVAIVKALEAAQDLWHGRPDDRWYRLAVDALRLADALFLEESDRLHRAFAEEARPEAHPAVRAVRARVQDILAGCDTVLIAGGHVGILRNRLQFFGFAEHLAGRRVVAWSAGAMALTDRVLLFHDHTSFGPGTAELLDRGLGLVPGVVYLPHARARLDLADHRTLAILHDRLAPARALTLENGAVLLDGLHPEPGPAAQIGADGRLHPPRAADATGP